MWNSAIKHIICLSTCLSLSINSFSQNLCIRFFWFFAYVNLKKMAEPNFLVKFIFAHNWPKKGTKNKAFQVDWKFLSFWFLRDTFKWKFSKFLIFCCKSCSEGNSCFFSYIVKSIWPIRLQNFWAPISQNYEVWVSLS